MAALNELNGNITHPAGNGPHLTVQHGSGTAALRGLAAGVALWAHVWTLYIAPTDSPSSSYMARSDHPHGTLLITGARYNAHCQQLGPEQLRSKRLVLQSRRLFSGLVQRGGNAVNTASLQA
jgi:hypothetical protein